jgi:ABC-type nitrate/sulfonate/bicarbonate transport system ATPase subunit
VIVLTYRPGRIKKEFRVKYPRPREYRTTPGLAVMASKVLDVMKEEMDRAMREVLE